MYPGSFAGSYNPYQMASVPGSTMSIPGQYNPMSQDYNATLGSSAGSTKTPPSGQVLGASTSNNGPVTADYLKSIGFNDPNVINGILSDPNQMARYAQNFKANNVGGVSEGDVNNAYNDVFNTLNQRESNLQAGKQDYLNAAASPYDQLTPEVEGALATGKNLNAQQSSQAQGQQANAISAAQSLYNELQQRTNQQFGGQGANSTADFANAFYGRALGQNLNQIYQTGGQNIAALQTQLQNLQQQHDTAVQKIQTEKANALSQAQAQFQQRIDEIESMKGQAAQNKAQMQLEALQQLRTNAQNIENNFTGFLQNLQAGRQQADLNLRNYITSVQATAGQSVPMQGYSNPYYTLPGQSGTQSFNPNQIFGTVNPQQGNRTQFGYQGF